MAHGFLNGARYDEETSSLASIIERSVTELKIPEGTTKIGNYAFSYCVSLKKISIPEGVTTIGANALNATGLTELVLPLSCEAIYSYSLYNNQNLKSIIFGDIKTIGDHGIGSVDRCMIFDFSRCTTVPTLTNAFNVNAKGKIYVPAELYSEWIEATNWSSLAEYIVPVYAVPEVTVPDYVSEGLDHGYFGEWYGILGRGSCTDTCVVIPAEIDGKAVQSLDGFFRDDLIEECWVWLPGVEMSSNFLYGCSNLKRFYLDASIGQSLAFGWNASLEYVKLGSHVTKVADGVFIGCANVVFDFSDCTAIPHLDFYEVGSEMGTDMGSEFGENPTIVVPMELYDDWKGDTNWSQYAEYIVAAK